MQTQTQDINQTSLYIPDLGLFNIYHFLMFTISSLRLIKNLDSITHIYIEYGDWTSEYYNYKKLETTNKNPHISNAQYRANTNNTNNFVMEIFTILFPNKIIIDNVKTKPPNCIILPNSECPDGSPQPEAYIFLQNLLMPFITSQPPYYLASYPEYIFISRNKDSDRRHILNEIELFEKCESLQKFQKITLSDFTLIEQMRLFNNAKFIIAAHGASLVNTIFCNKPVTVVEITSDYLVNKQYFKHIAETFTNIHHKYYFARRHVNPIYGAGDGMAENLSIDDYNAFNNFISNI